MNVAVSRFLAAVGAVVTMTGSAAAQDFTAQWDAAIDGTPEGAVLAWQLSDSAEPEDPIVGAGILTLSTSDHGENLAYVQQEPLIDPEFPIVLEFRVRVVSSTSTGPNRSAAMIAVTTEPNVGTVFGIGVDEIFLVTAGDVRGASAVVDTNDALHDYRIMIESSGAVSVSYDDAPLLVDSTFESAPTHTGTSRVLWGEFSSLAFGTSEWQLFRHTAALAPGACATVPEPSDECLGGATGKSLLKIKSKGGGKDLAFYKIAKGDAVTLGEFGDPTEGMTDYRLCLYDMADSSPELLIDAPVPSGGECAGRPCWKSKRKGYLYKHKEGSADGVALLQLKAGNAEKSLLKVALKKSNFVAPVPPLSETSVVAQLLSTEGLCWQTDFAAPKKNADSSYIAKGGG